MVLSLLPGPFFRQQRFSNEVMMLGVLLKLVPALRWPIISPGQGRNHEQIAITSCISAVKGYFPCNTTPIPDYTCLCEQYLWRVSCFDSHASNPASHPDRPIAENYMSDYCHAAGSIGAEEVHRKHQRQRRQIGDLLSSIVGDVSSVLSSNGVAVPTAIIESVAGSVVNALPTPANPTSIAAEITATIATDDASSTARSVVQTSTGASSTRNEVSSTASQEQISSSSTVGAAAASSDSSSGPSTGLIAGVVVGGVAALALIGIFILLLLRHRKKKSRTAAIADKEASAAASSSSDRSPPTHGAYAHVPQQDAYPTTTTLPTQTNMSSTQPTTMMSPVSPITPASQAPWASTSTFGGATAMGAGAGTAAAAAVAGQALHSSTPAPRYSDEKPPQHHQYLDSKIPESNEMPTNANVWEIDGREMPPPSELDAGRRDGLNLGNVGSHVQAQGQTEQQEYVAYRPPSAENGQANWSGQNGEFLGNRPVGQAI